MSRPKPSLVLACALGLGAVGCGPYDPPADTIFFGENIVTMNPNQPTVGAVAVRGETIVAVGARADLMRLRGDATRMVDLGDHALLPGFIDAHGHVESLGQNLQSLGLEPPPVGDVTSIHDIVTKIQQWIRDKNIPPGEVVTGRGYDDSVLKEGRHPTKLDLDRASTDHPIILTHVSGHLTAVNSAALAAAHISAATKDPPGGHIRRVEGSAEPNGVLEEEANEMVHALRPKESSVDTDALVRNAIAVYSGYGTTTVQDGYSTRESVKVMRAAADREPFEADVVAFPVFDEAMIDDPSTAGYDGTYDNGFRVGGVKFVLDGSPQGRTAWVTRPYDEGPQGMGPNYVAYPTMDPALYKRGAAALIKGGVPFLAHANGDAAMDLMLDGVEEAVAGMDPMPDHRSVIIHAQLMRSDQVDRAARLVVVPSFFAAHSFFWGDWHRRSFGEDRAKNISPGRWAVERGVHFTIHNDAPVVPPDIMRLVSIAVNRKTRSGFVLGPDQRLTVMEALKAVTVDAAYQYFEENVKGSITVGKQADLVILGQNPLTVDPETLADIPIVETFSRGRSVFKK